MTGDHTRARGRRAEEKACQYLEHLGFVIIEKNFRTRTAEIDLIARDGEWLVFIEIKSRKTESRGLAREAVTPAKQRRIILAAQSWIALRRIQNTRMRFDVLAIQGPDGCQQFELIRHAFEAL